MSTLFQRLFNKNSDNNNHTNHNNKELSERQRQQQQREKFLTEDQILAHKARVGCQVCADKGERTADNQFIPGTFNTPQPSIPTITGQPMTNAFPTYTPKLQQLDHDISSTITITSPSSPSSPTTITTPPAQITTPQAITPETTPTHHKKSPQVSLDHEQAEQTNDDCHCLAYQNSICPLNRRELGRASWAYLHTLAATYPVNPTPSQQKEMSEFVFTFAKLYPCGYCADYTRNEMIRKPPRVESREQFQLWMCGIHNEVNDRMSKPLFDCSKVNDRWGKGPIDGSCGVSSL